MRAVIDRIENGMAVTLFGENEIKADIPVELLPQGSKEGSWLKVGFELDIDKETNQRKKISDLLDKLKNKG